MGIFSFTELASACREQNKHIYEIAQEEEARIAEVDTETIRLRTLENLTAMKDAIKNGLKSKEKSISNWCGDDCAKLQTQYKKHSAILG